MRLDSISIATIRMAFFVLFCLVALVSCGGGGGSGGSDLTPKSKRQNFRSADTTTAQAQLTQVNVLSYLSGLHSLLEPSFGLINGRAGGAGYHDIFKYTDRFRSGLLCENFQEGKELDRSVSGDSATDVFSNCVGPNIDYAAGRVHYQVQNVVFDQYGDRVSFEIRVDIDDFYFEADYDNLTVDGTIIVSSSEYNVTDLAVRYEKSGLAFHAKDLTVGQQYPYFVLSGKVYMDDQGWVEINYTSQDRLLRMTGRNGELLADATRNNFHIFDEYKLNFSLDSEAFPFNGVLPAAAILNRLTLENAPPQPDVGDELMVDRLASATFSADPSLDSNYDLLKHVWTHMESPPGCMYSAEQISNADFDFSSQCQGFHTLELLTSDGTSEVRSEHQVEVVPLPAEFAELGQQSIVAEQNINVRVEVLNASTDGPFTYALEYAPKGVEISESGVLSGIPRSYVSQGKQYFTVGVKAENVHSVVQEVKLLVDQPFDAAYRKHFELTEHTHDFDNDGNVETLSLMEDSYMLFELNGLAIEVDYVELNPPSESTLKQAFGQDVNMDGIKDIVLVYGEMIFIVDGVTKSIIAEQPVFWDYTYWELRPIPYGYPGFLVLADYQYSSEKRIIQLLKSVGDTGFESYNGLDGSFFYSISMVENIDADPDPEILARRSGNLRSIYDTENPPLALTEPSEIPVDINDDGVWEILHFAWNSQTNLFEFEVKNILTGASLSLDTFSPYSNSLSYTPSSFFVEVDGDVTPEFAVLDAGTTIFDIADDGSFSEIYRSDNALKDIASGPEGNFAYTSDGWATFDLANGFQSLEIVDFGFSNNLHKIALGKIDVDSFQFFNIVAGDGFTDLKKYVYGAPIEPQAGEILEPQGVFKGSNSEIYPMPWEQQIQEEMLITHRRTLGHFLYGLNPFEELFVTDFARGTTEGGPWHYEYGNVNGDGNLDIFASDLIRLLWIDPFSNSIVWEAPQSVTASQLADVDGDGIDEIVGISSATSSVYVYKSVGGSVVPVTTLTFPLVTPDGELLQPPSLGYVATLGIQDVNGDGILDIVVGTRENWIHVFDGDLNLLSRSQFEENIDVIPSIKTGGPKQNVIALDSQERSLSYGDVSTVTRFIELDVGENKVVWRSGRFYGRPYTDNAMIQLDDDPYDSQKAGLFRFPSGLYYFR